MGTTGPLACSRGASGGWRGACSGTSVPVWGAGGRSGSPGPGPVGYQVEPLWPQSEEGSPPGKRTEWLPRRVESRRGPGVQEGCWEGEVEDPAAQEGRSGGRRRLPVPEGRFGCRAWGTLAEMLGALGHSAQRHLGNKALGGRPTVGDLGPRRLREGDAGGGSPRGRSRKAGPEGGAPGLRGRAPEGCRFPGLGRGRSGRGEVALPPAGRSLALWGARVSARLPWRRAGAGRGLRGKEVSAQPRCGSRPRRRGRRR